MAGMQKRLQHALLGNNRTNARPSPSHNGPGDAPRSGVTTVSVLCQLNTIARIPMIPIGAEARFVIGTRWLPWELLCSLQPIVGSSSSFLAIPQFGNSAAQPVSRCVFIRSTRRMQLPCVKTASNFITTTWLQNTQYLICPGISFCHHN